MQNRAPRVQSPPDNNSGTFRISWVQIDQQTPDVGPMPDHCWASVADAVPIMVWHWARFWRSQGEILTGSVLVREWDRSDCDSFLWSSSGGDDPIQAADLQGLFWKQDGRNQTIPRRRQKSAYHDSMRSGDNRSILLYHVSFERKI